MKRAFSLTLLVLFILIALAACWYYFQRYYGIKSGNALNAIPADAACVIEANLASGIIPQLQKAAYWKEFQSNKYFNKTAKSIVAFNNLLQTNNDGLKELFEREKLFISVHVTKANEFDLLFLINLPVPDQKGFVEHIIKKLSGSDAEPQSRSYADVEINEFPMSDGNTFTYAVSKNIFLGSFTPFLVEDAIRQQKAASSFFKHKQLLNEISGAQSEVNSNAKVYLNNKNLPEWLSVFKEANMPVSFNELSSFASWTATNLNVNENSFQCSGTVLSKDSAEIAYSFLSQEPVPINLLKILPKKTAAVIAFGISDKEKFFHSFQNHLSFSDNSSAGNALLNKVKTEYKFSPKERFYGLTGDEFALLITEPSSANYDNSAYFILKTNSSVRAKKELQAISALVDKKQNEVTKQENYNGFSIGLIRLQGVIPALYGNIFKRVNKMYYTFFGNYIVFANQAVALRSLLDDYKSGRLLYKEENFKTVTAKVGLTANYFLYCHPPASRYIFKSILSASAVSKFDSSKTFFDKWDSFLFSVSNKNKKLTASAFLQYNSTSAIDETSLLWTAQLDTSVSMKPQVIMNSTGQSHNIMVQDDANNLYLIDPSGNITWKKQITEKIVGDIHTIDLYKNNSSEYLFSTANYLFLIGINGETISNYPIRLPAEATNAHAVLDFDKTRDYRIYIACDNGKIIGYDGSGKRLSGWSFNYSTGMIDQPVQSFNINGKDYLIASDNLGTVFILDRTGRTLINARNKIIRRNSVPFYLNEDTSGAYNFVTLDTTGNIVTIDPDGETHIKSIEALTSSEHFILADINNDHEADYIFAEQDEVSAYTSQMALLFNQPLKGAIADGMDWFRLNNSTTALGVYSSSADKLFLFHSDGTIFNGFPVKGSTPFIIDELNSDGKFYLIASDSEGSVYVYSLGTGQ